MPDQKLSQLPAGAPIADGDLFYSDQLGNSVSQAANALATYMATKLAGGAYTTTYYISAAGNDANNGTSPATPWASIAKVNSILFPNPGTAFLFRGGDTFSGNITINAGGIAGAPITYSSYGAGQATINAGNGNGIAFTDLGNIAITNLNINGSGITTSTGHGVFGHGTGSTRQNFLISGLTITNMGYSGVYFFAGDPSGLTFPIWSNITVTQCTIHDCGINAVQVLTNNGPGNTTTPYFLAFANVLVDRVTAYNITGQNTLSASVALNGNGAACQGVNGFTVQFCHFYNNAEFAHTAPATVASAGPAIYTANATNILFQFNEVHGQFNIGTNGHDGGGIMTDFGCSNALVQYNYLHDNASFGLACGTLSLTINSVVTPQNNSNMVFRYNVVANNGTVQPNSSLAGGMILYTLTLATETVTGLAVYNNTFVVKGSINDGAIIDETIGHIGTISGVIANNLLIGDANTILVNYFSGLTLRFIGNDYVGGSNVRKAGFGGGFYTTIAAWLAATSPLQEAIDGVSVLVTPVDPLLSGLPYPIQSPAAGGYVPGRVSNFELSPSSTVGALGIDLTSVLPYQTALPSDQSSIDFDFKGGVYVGDVIGSITCSRTATTATDLLSTSPQGASFNTFGANTLRITPGKGLLIEEARTQFLANPGAPATQTTASLSSAAAYILWVNGPGSAVVSAGTATPTSSNGTSLTAVQGKIAMFQINTNGTVVITVNGTLNQFQLENDNNGAGLPTSFISAIGTRDADVVTTTTAHTIGLVLSQYLGGAPGGNNTAYAQFFFNIPYYIAFLNRAMLIADSNSLSYLGLEDHSAGGFIDRHIRGISALGGGITLRTSNDILFNTRQAIAGRTDTVNGQALVLNGGTIATSSSTALPAIGTTIYIGNRAAGDQPLNGYIERITTANTTNVQSATQLQTNTSTVPIATGISQDYFGNLAPNGQGKYSIGAHQPIIAAGGGGGTPGGTSGQVQYNNGGAFGGFGYWDGSVTLSIANGATAEALRVYQTVDNPAAPTNFVRGVADWTTNAGRFTVGAQQGGSGGNMGLTLTSRDNTVFDMPVGSYWLFQVGGNNKYAGHNAGYLSTVSGGAFAFDPSASNAGGVSFDSGIARVAPGVVKTIVDVSLALGGFIQWSGLTRVTSDFSVTSSTALVNVTGLSVSLSAGRTYQFETELYVTDAAAGGVQAAIAGTATATAIQYTGYTIADNAIKGKTNATALATAVGSTVTTETAGIIVRITGIITVNAAGTLTVQMAQNTSNGTATVAKRGSWFKVYDMP